MSTMNTLISAFPENLKDAIQIAHNATFKNPSNSIHHVLICGLGGSGIGGKMVAQWVQSVCPVPVLSFQDYDIPAYVGKNSLVIASSYSGNTEETLISVDQAHQKGAHIIGICSGGELKQFCESNDYDVVLVPGGNPPRTALAFSIVQVTNILAQLGLAEKSLVNEFETGRQLLVDQAETIHTEAKKIASFLQGKVPVIYSTTKYEPIAVRARQQFNENSKELCWHHVIPEMNHNELVGWGGGDDRFAAIFLETTDLHPRNQKRLEYSLSVVRSKTKHVFELMAQGNTMVERSLYFIHVIDWASFYLAELKNVDPIDIAVIDTLKDTLSKF